MKKGINGRSQNRKKKLDEWPFPALTRWLYFEEIGKEISHSCVFVTVKYTINIAWRKLSNDKITNRSAKKNTGGINKLHVEMA